jgi:hypothetical protein
MTQADSLTGVLVQCGVLIVIGALMVLVMRLVRFRPAAPSIPDPRRSALWACCAIGVGWMLVLVLFVVTRGNTVKGDEPQVVSHASVGAVTAQSQERMPRSKSL